MGIAEAMYPHPDRWRLADIDAPLDRVGVREMTRAFARREALAPNCKRKWDSLLGPTNWETVAKRYKQGFLTPKDYGSHYKCIAHRGLCTRKRKPSEAGLTSCRICGKTDETVEHLGECEGLKEVYTSLRKLDEKGEGARVVNSQGDRFVAMQTQLREETFKVNGLGGRHRRGHYLGLARG